MGKIYLYTVQPFKDTGKYSSADATGLTKYLGYRPIFCSRLDENSVSKSWFRVIMASPGYADCIHMFEMDEKDCIPMNVVKWTNRCFGEGAPTNEDFEACIGDAVKNDDPDMLDYLIKEIPDERHDIPVKMLIFGANEEFLEDIVDEEEKKGFLIATMCAFNTIREFVESGAFRTPDNKVLTTENLHIDAIYRLLMMTNLFVVNYSAFFNIDIPMYLSLGSLFNGSHELLNELFFKLSEWDSTMNTNEDFDEGEFLKIRDAFITIVNQATNIETEEFAKKINIERNDPCFCGSDKKFKKCCYRKTLDEIVNGN